MTDDGKDPAGAGTDGRASLPAAAARALAEAEARRKARDAEAAKSAEELDRKGLDPTRYGDWEKRGIVSDF